MAGRPRGAQCVFICKSLNLGEISPRERASSHTLYNVLLRPMASEHYRKFKGESSVTRKFTDKSEAKNKTKQPHLNA